MIRQLLPHPWLTPAFACIWLLLNNTLAAGHVLLGLVLGWLIPVLTPGFWPEPLQFHRPMTLMKLAWVFLWDILVANLNVAQVILGSQEKIKSGFFVVPLDIKKELTISLLAHTISLTPGTLSVELGQDKSCLIVHALDMANPLDLIEEIKSRYEAPLKRVFES